MVDPCDNHRQGECFQCDKAICLVCTETACVVCCDALCSDCSNRRIPPLKGFLNDEVTIAHGFDCERACHAICARCDTPRILSIVNEWNQVCGVDSLHWELKTHTTAHQIFRNPITLEAVEGIKARHNFYTKNEHNLREELSFDPTPFLRCTGNKNYSVTLSEAIREPARFVPNSVYARILERCYYLSLELKKQFCHFEFCVRADTLVLQPIRSGVQTEALIAIRGEKRRLLSLITDPVERNRFEIKNRAALSAHYPILWPWKRERVLALLASHCAKIGSPRVLRNRLYAPGGGIAQELCKRFTRAAKRQAAPHESQRDPKRTIVIE